jgi:hypothetical protein
MQNSGCHGNQKLEISLFKKIKELELRYLAFTSDCLPEVCSNKKPWVKIWPATGVH